MELTESQITRQDYVDNKIFELIHNLIPSDKELDWNLEMIADIRETIRYWLVDRCQLLDEQEFYPFIEEGRGNGC
ncbi:MAG: hypothetical protein P9M15_02130 [Candidatus Electryoneaceae bacterium]|nr:hypothetical protein [Candidatus Electryoneaceae bacterium]